MSDEIKLTITDDTAAGAASVEKSLQGIEAQADDSQSSLDALAQSIDTLAENLTKETKVLHEHTASWTHLGAEAIPAIADMVGNVVKYSGELSTLVVRFIDVEKTVKRAVSTQQAMNLAKQQALNVTAKAAGALTGYAEAVSGVLVGLAAVKAAHVAFNTLLENTGKSADGVTNNLTRTREANSQLWDDIKATASAGAEAAGEWGTETVANATATSIVRGSSTRISAA